MLIMKTDDDGDDYHEDIVDDDDDFGAEIKPALFRPFSQIWT